MEERLPISVVFLQVDGDDPYLLDKVVGEIVQDGPNTGKCRYHLGQKREEAEVFWEDRHKLSRYCQRTSGFKLNEGCGDSPLPGYRILRFYGTPES